MQHIFYTDTERGTKDIGWLLSKFSFSFSSYQNPVRKISDSFIHSMMMWLNRVVALAFTHPQSQQ